MGHSDGVCRFLDNLHTPNFFLEAYMIKIKVYKGPTGEFTWSAFNEGNENLFNCSRTYTTERNLVVDLKEMLGDMRQPVSLIGYQQPMMLMNTPKI